jgi:UbiD family decarboxylase
VSEDDLRGKALSAHARAGCIASGFLEGLRKDGLLKEVHEPVSPVLDVTLRSWGAGPILFHNINGHKCCLNILGNRDLLARALCIPANDMVRHLSSIDYQGQVKEVGSSPFQEVVSKPDLSKLPILTYFEGDGGPYITSAVVVAQYGDRLNACVHRLMALEIVWRQGWFREGILTSSAKRHNHVARRCL